MLYRMRTGCPWRDLPDAFGAWNAIYKRFRAGSQSGQWWRVFKAVVSDPDLEWAFIDGTYAKAHQHSAGAVGPAAQTIGKSRAGLTTKLHLVVDAEAICEAVSRPNMRFVAIKTPEQQSVLALHRARQGFVKARTAQGNQIRGLLGEFGIVIAQGLSAIRRHLPDILEDAENELADDFRCLVARWGNTSRHSTDKSMSWRVRSNNGIARMRPAAGWHRFS